VFCHLVVPVRLSVPVQVIDWNDSTYNVLMGTLNPTHSLTHSLLDTGQPTNKLYAHVL